MRATALFKLRVNTPYKSAKSLSNMTLWPLIRRILRQIRSEGTIEMFLSGIFSFPLQMSCFSQLEVPKWNLKFYYFSVFSVPSVAYYILCSPWLKTTSFASKTGPSLQHNLYTVSFEPAALHSTAQLWQTPIPQAILLSRLT